MQKCHLSIETHSEKAAAFRQIFIVGSAWCYLASIGTSRRPGLSNVLRPAAASTAVRTTGLNKKDAYRSRFLRTTSR